MTNSPKTGPASPLVDKAVKTLQLLAVDAVESAKSGHPGLPMGTADFAFVLWTRFLRFNPADPAWPGRDRFVLSAGHGSMLQYAMLHLLGYDVSLDDLKQFRQWDSKTPGHPEFGHTPGVEVTTGPLGQGFGNGVGMALAAKMLQARFGSHGQELMGHRIFAIVSDGDLMEGVSAEAASVAGHLGLGNLVYFYDDNRVTIDGKTDISFSEDVAKRFEAHGWHVLKIDGHDHEQIEQALAAGIGETRRPTLIVGRTVIGKGSPGRQGTSKAHSDAFGADEVKATKENLGWPLSPVFTIPDDVRALFQARAAELKPEYDRWQGRLVSMRREQPDLGKLWDAHFSPKLPDDLEQKLLASVAGAAPVATRVASGNAIQAAAAMLPGLIGGSADLAVSVKTTIGKSPAVTRENFEGRNIHFGVREHAMGAILNGLSLHGGFRPFGGTFLVFSDYMRPSIRLAALMRQPVVYVFTHDSIFVGEDGPTHEPIEHVQSLRLIPNLTVIRPGDARETALAWASALRNTTGPTALILTRQNLPPIDPAAHPDISGAARGGYVLSDGGGSPDLVLIGTGSELHLAMGAAEILAREDGLKVRVVSLPCPTIFDAQPKAYRDQVLPPACRKRVSVEAGTTHGWERYVGLDGLAIGIDRFGASAPYQILAEKFGFTTPQVVNRIRTWLKQ